MPTTCVVIIVEPAVGIITAQRALLGVIVDTFPYNPGFDLVINGKDTDITMVVSKPMYHRRRKLPVKGCIDGPIVVPLGTRMRKLSSPASS